MILKVGKTYLTRDGQRVLIEAEITRQGMYTMQGVYVEGGHCCDPYNHRALGVTWRRKDGRMSRARHRLDLVMEEKGNRHSQNTMACCSKSSMDVCPADDEKNHDDA